MPDALRILVLGIGNILWADEGFGVRAVEALDRWYDFPDNVALLDGGTQGLYLVQRIRETDVLVVLDAVDYGLAPGTLKCIEGDRVPRYLGARKVSLHQTGFQEVLATAAMLGDYPAHICLVGVQPECIEDFGGSLSACTRSRIEPALSAACEYLARFGVRATRRSLPRDVSTSLAGPELDMREYENNRPSAGEACRIGDDRVLGSSAYALARRDPAAGPDAVSIDVDQRDFR